MAPRAQRQLRGAFRAAIALMGHAAAAFLLLTDGGIASSARGLRAFRGLSTSSSDEMSPYTKDDVLWTQRNYTYRNALVIFDGENDSFKTYFELMDGKDPNRDRRYWPRFLLDDALRKNFPERFGPGKPSFQVLFSVHDLPRTECLNTPRDCKTEAFAPILHFGSVPRDKSIMPSLVQMPLPSFAGCMVSGVNTGNYDCGLFETPKSAAPAWDDLIPQIVWRGRNFWFLPHFGYGHWQHAVHVYRDANPWELSKEEVADSLLNRHWDKLTPRWRGVALSLKAKLDAQRNGTMPWIDVQFFLKGNQDDKMLSYVKTGNPVGTSEYMGEEELMQYKYHIDFGGGGGTTWDGTIRKLAMPGLLFHHETVMKDWFYDEIKPWVHYVPIEMDISDLREKYEWAEQHPEEAERIAKAGTEFVEKGIKEYVKGSYKSLFVDKLGEIVRAYKPSQGETVESILKEYKQLGIEMVWENTYS